MPLHLWSCTRSTSGRRHASSGISCPKFFSVLCSPTVFFFIFKGYPVKQFLDYLLQPKLQPIFRILYNISLNSSSTVHCSPNYRPNCMFANKI